MYQCHLCTYALMESTFPAGANVYQALPTVPKRSDKFRTLGNVPICPPQYILLFSKFHAAVIMFCTLRWVESL